jgi:hypothetical protein
VTDRRAVEKLLGTRLPADVTDVAWKRWRASPDLPAYTAFMRLELPAASARSLVHELGTVPRGADAATDFFLNSGWHVPEGVRPPWFVAPADVDEDAAARSFGVNGWLLSAYRDGALYVLATDEGHLTGTPGPW